MRNCSRQIFLCSFLLGPALAAEETPVTYPEAIQIALDSTTPLQHPRGDRLPLLLWPALEAVVEDEALQEKVMREFDRRGLAVMATWNYDEKDKSLADALRTAAIQKKLGLPVMINANPSMYAFFNGEEKTAHTRENGERFFDSSFGEGHKMGCAFAADHRYPEMKERIDFFARAFHERDLPVDMVWGDWEIDGPHEFNRSWESAKACTVCREHIPGIEAFAAYQKAMRIKRADMTRTCYTEPILSRFPKALVGNYAVYPHDGYRYWYDYFEYFVDYQPHIADQRARYRAWYDEFDLTGYTFAMPVVYTWQDIFTWYDFDDPDYRWFYNMLKVASNAARHTGPKTPIIAFVHWTTIAVGREADPEVKQMSARAYQELLWHCLLRGFDGLFLWSGREDWSREGKVLHEVYAASLEYAKWLDNGTPIDFSVPDQPGPVISGLKMGNQVLVRRTDFGTKFQIPVTIKVDGQDLVVPVKDGACQVLTLGD
jgi:hypothetical protein